MAAAQTGSICPSTHEHWQAAEAYVLTLATMTAARNLATGFMRFPFRWKYGPTDEAMVMPGAEPMKVRDGSQIGGPKLTNAESRPSWMATKSSHSTMRVDCGSARQGGRRGYSQDRGVTAVQCVVLRSRGPVVLPYCQVRAGATIGSITEESRHGEEQAEHAARKSNFYYAQWFAEGDSAKMQSVPSSFWAVQVSPAEGKGGRNGIGAAQLCADAELLVIAIEMRNITPKQCHLDLPNSGSAKGNLSRYRRIEAQRVRRTRPRANSCRMTYRSRRS